MHDYFRINMKTEHYVHHIVVLSFKSIENAQKKAAQLGPGGGGGAGLIIKYLRVVSKSKQGALELNICILCHFTNQFKIFLVWLAYHNGCLNSFCV